MMDPESIAVIGASQDPMKIGGRIFAYLRQYYKGELIPINARESNVQGLVGHPTISDLDAPPDLAIVAVPGEAAIKAAEQAAARGAKASIVIASGFAETNEEGKSFQRTLERLSLDSGMRILGPNSVGLINQPKGVWATFQPLADDLRDEGPIAIVSRSGAIGTNLSWNLLQQRGLGVSFACATGNEVDVNLGEVISYLASYGETKAIVLALEGSTNFESLRLGAELARSRGIPVVGLAYGTSSSGALASSSHTGAITGNDDAISAVFDELSIVRARSLTEMVDIAVSFGTEQPQSGGRRLGVVTASGGAGALIADTAEGVGLVLPEFSSDLRSRLSLYVPSFGSTRNPIDTTGQGGLGAFEGTIKELSNHSEIDVLVAVHLPEPLTDFISSRDLGIPVIVVSESPRLVRTLIRRGVPAVDDPVRAVKMAEVMCRQAASVKVRTGGPPVESGRGGGAGRQVRVAHEPQDAWLRSYGLPLLHETAVGTSGGAVEAAAAAGYPVVLKLHPDVAAHKSDVGGVHRNLTTPAAVQSAFEELSVLAARLGSPVAEPVIVQHQLSARIELAIGGIRDRLVGPLVTFGMGGTLIEIVRATVTATCPLGQDQAMSLIARICDGRLLSSPRGLTAEEATEFAHLVARVSELLNDVSDIAEIDLNPVILDNSGKFYVVDTLVNRDAGYAMQSSPDAEDSS